MYIQSGMWCVHTVRYVVCTYSQVCGVYIQSGMWCVHTVRYVVCTYSQVCGVYIQSGMWCVHTVRYVVCTYSQVCGVYIQSGMWCVHTVRYVVCTYIIQSCISLHDITSGFSLSGLDCYLHNPRYLLRRLDCTRLMTAASTPMG